jgi:hypothetical protein
MVYKIACRANFRDVTKAFRIFEKALAYGFADNTINRTDFLKDKERFVLELKEHSGINYDYGCYPHQGYLYFRFATPGECLDENFYNRVVDYFGYNNLDIDISECPIGIQEESIEWSEDPRYVEQKYPHVEWK